MTTAVSKPPNEPLVPVASAAPRRRRRWPRRVLAVLLVLVAAWLWLVPPLARWLLIDRLHAAGFRDVSVAETRVGFGTVHVGYVRLGRDGAGQVVIPGVTAELGLGDLLAGRLSTLILDGPIWSMAPGSAASPFDGVMQRAQQAVDAPVTALPDLPVRKLTIRNGHVVGPQPIAFDGELVASDTRWNVALRAAGAGQGVHLAAQLDVAPALAHGAVTLKTASEQPLELRGTFRSEVVGGARVLDVELRRDAAPFQMTLGATTWSGDGAITMRTHAPLADLAAATVDVKLDDVSLVGSNGFSLAGLAAAAKVTGLPVPASAGPQQVRWRSAQFAALKVGEGSAEIDLQQGLKVLARVEQQTSDGTGAITFSGLRYTAGAGSMPAHVEFDRVPLQEWLEALSKGRITGQGRLQGEADVVITWAPRLDVELQGGHLTSSGGLVHFLDDDETTGLIRQQVEQIAAATGHDNLVKERLVGALQQFAYDTLDFRIEPEADGEGVTLRVHTAGKGRIVPQELDLTVNLHGFDAALDTALAIKLGLDRAQQRLDDKIDKTDEPKPRDEQR